MLEAPETKTLELKVNKHSWKPVVYLVWSGKKNLPLTHSLRCIHSTEELAKRRVDGLNSEDYRSWRPSGEEDIDYWYEEMDVDHMYAESMYKNYTRLMNKLKTSE